ncbi:hypothetical protein U1Q18_000728 [Sarracenia purpurea var. burkii]
MRGWEGGNCTSMCDLRLLVVRELEDGLLQLLAASEDCTHFSSAIQSVGNGYQPGEEVPENYFSAQIFFIVLPRIEFVQSDFKKLIDDEIAKSKANSSSVPQNNLLLRQFREAIWRRCDLGIRMKQQHKFVGTHLMKQQDLNNILQSGKIGIDALSNANIHHAGQPMPGEEQEDLVMTSTQCNLLNIICPLTGKPITELADPVRSIDCKHIYEKNAITQYIMSKHAYAQCPVAGCPKILLEKRVVCDPLLLVEIDEMRLLNKQSAKPDVVEDFTELDEEDDPH